MILHPSPRAPDLIGSLHATFLHRADNDPVWSTIVIQPARHGASRSSPTRRSAPALAAGDAPEAARLLLCHRLPVVRDAATQTPIGVLLQRAWRGAATPDEDAALKIAGIRPIQACDRATMVTCYCRKCRDDRGRLVPRAGADDGAWLSNRSPAMEALFATTDFAGRWRQALLGLSGARRSLCNVRIGRHAGGATWLAAGDLQALMTEQPRPP